jgi:Na+/H+ antiporter NhaD/arsenite permease-like protein
MNLKPVLPYVAWLLAVMAPAAVAATDATGPASQLTGTGLGMLAVLVFIVAYALVVSEEFSQMRKSKPVIVGAGIIWVLVAIAYGQQGDNTTAARLLRHNLLEYAELLLFLLSAMTFINTMEERRVFQALRSWLVRSGFSLRTIYWLTGLLAFIISPVADNLTTALLMAAVALAVAGDNKRFIVVACISIVVGANAGGASAPSAISPRSWSGRKGWCASRSSSRCSSRRW